jgi:hypothetical protein
VQFKDIDPIEQKPEPKIPAKEESVEEVTEQEMRPRIIASIPITIMDDNETIFTH